MYRDSVVMDDPGGDSNGSRNIVGDSSHGSAAISNDGSYIYFRLRLDDDPSGTGGQGYLQSFGWGFDIDTDGDLGTYEWLMIIDGITSPESISLWQNTVQSTLGSPSDQPEIKVVSIPLDPSFSWFHVIAADTFTNGDQDYFLDWKFHYATFKDILGVTDNSVFAFFAGSSSAANTLTESGADLVGPSDLYAGFSDFMTPLGTTITDGIVSFVADTAGNGNVTSEYAGNTLYVKVYDKDQNNNRGTSQTVTVILTAPNGDSESLVLTETGLDTDIFTSSIGTTFSTTHLANDGTLQVIPGEIVTVTYIDEIDSDANVNVVRTDTLFIYAPSVSINKSVTPAIAVGNDTVAYTITVNNSGPEKATITGIADTLPPGFSYTPGTTTGITTDEPAISGQQLSWTNTWEISSGGSLSLSFNAVTNPLTGTYYNNASVSLISALEPVVSTGDTAPVTVSNTDLSLTKTVDNYYPNIGDTVLFTVTAANSGSIQATGVEVTDLLPAGLTYISSLASQGSYDNGSGAWAVGSIDAGNSATLQITATMNSGLEQINTAEITAADTPDPDSTPGNNDITEDDQDRIRLQAVSDLSLTKTDSTDPIDSDQILTYTITVTNNGPSAANHIVVTDYLPSGSTFISASGTNWSCSHSSGIVTCAKSEMADTEISTITISVYPPAVAGDHTNTATVVSDNNDLTAANNTQSVITTVNPVIDIRITGSDDPDPVTINQSLSYELTVKNNGPSTATNVTVTNTIPAGTTYKTTAASGWNCSHALGVVTCTRAQLLSGSSAVITIVLTSPSTTGIITNSASVSATEDDTDPTNNTTSENTTVEANADLELTKTSTPNPFVGIENGTSAVLYTITIKNNGPVDATNVQLVDNLPVQALGNSVFFNYASSSPGQGTCSYDDPSRVVNCDLGTIANGDVAVVYISSTITVATSLPVTHPENNATVTSDRNDPDTSNNEDTDTILINSIKSKSTDMEILKSDSADPVAAGDTVTYNLTVNNNGSNDASDVLVYDTLPPGVTFVSATPESGTCGYSSATHKITCALGKIQKNRSKIITVFVITTEAGTITNTARVSIDIGETDPSNNTANETTLVLENDTTISVTKSVDTSTVTSGDTVTYQITIVNTGSYPAEITRITDSLPADFTYITDTTTDMTTNNPVDSDGILKWDGAWTVTSAAVLSFQAHAGRVAGTHYNNVIVTGSNFDLTVSGDSAPVTVTAPLLALTKQADNSSPAPGDEVTYTVYYVNIGDGFASDVQIIDKIPIGATYVNGSMRMGDASSTYTNATPLSDAPDTDEGTLNGDFVMFTIPGLEKDDGIDNSGDDEGKVYFKILIP